jgi:hypothetical protein
VEPTMNISSRKNYQDKQKLNQEKIDAGLVSEKFSTVSGIEIKMVYYRRTMYSDAERILMVRTVNVSPESYAHFYMQCMNNQCSEGFDLINIISGLVKKRNKQGSGSVYCTGKGPELPDKHARIHYVINIKYKSRSKKK